MKIRHKLTGLWLEVQNLGRPVAENDVYTHDEGTASVFKDRAGATKVAKRLGLLSKDFEIL